jgi:hypothetical protein
MTTPSDTPQPDTPPQSPPAATESPKLKPAKAKAPWRTLGSFRDSLTMMMDQDELVRRGPGGRSSF